MVKTTGHFDKETVEILVTFFNGNPIPSVEEIAKISQQVGLTEKQVFLLLIIGLSVVLST